jgi:hypothetical protein
MRLPWCVDADGYCCGAEYANAAEELGIADCFAGFLPKPTLIIDDYGACQ